MVTKTDSVDDSGNGGAAIAETVAGVEDQGEEISVEDALSFDPFDSENLNGEGEPTPDGGKDTPSEPGTEDSAGTTDKPEEGEVAAAPETPPTPELDLANAQIKSLTETVEAMKTVATQPQAPAEPTGEQEQVGPAFNFDIPDALLAKFDSEDAGDRKQALANMAQGVAQAAHVEAVKYVNDVMSQVMPQFVKEQMNLHTQQKVIFDDFYGEYPQYNRPELRSTVVGVAQAVLKESGLTEWSPALRDAVATRLLTLFPAGAAAPAKPAPAVPATPYMGGGGARPGKDLTPEAREQEDISNTLF